MYFHKDAHLPRQPNYFELSILFCILIGLNYGISN